MSTTVTRRLIFFKEDDGSEPVLDWLNRMKRKKLFVEHGRITSRINRAAQGNFGNHQMLGGAFGELKIDFGPGYRVYFGLVGNQLIVLLNGGSKNDQQADIELARSRWNRYIEANGKEDPNEKQ